LGSGRLIGGVASGSERRRFFSEADHEYLLEGARLAGLPV